MSWTAAGIGAVLFAVGVMLIWKAVAPRLRCWFMLAAGFAMAGLLGSLLGWIVDLISRVGGVTTRIVFGTGVPAIVLILIGVSLWIHMHPKRGRPTRLTPWLALLVGPLLGVMVGSAVGITVNEVLKAAGHTLSGALDQVLSSL